MARPIKEFNPTPRPEAEVRQENLDNILNQVADNHEALQQFLTIIEELHASGILDIVKSLLKTRNEVGEVAMNQIINQPKTLNIINNAMGAAEMLGSIDPEELNQVLAGVSSGIKEASKEDESETTLGIMGMLKATKEPDVQASLQMLFRFLAGMGQQVNSQDRKTK